MFVFKSSIFYLAVFYFFKLIEGLVELPLVEDNDIRNAEVIIRATTNKLFSTLKLKGTKNKTRVNRLALVHRYLVKLTLRDYNSLKEIAKLTRVDKDNISNGTQSFMVINEIIGEGIGSVEVNITKSAEVQEEVVNYIDDYMKRLDYLKYFYNALTPDNDIQQTAFMQFLKKEWNIPVESLSESSSSSNEDDVLLKNNDVWDREYGDTDTRRIFQGKRTKIKHYPFMASVEIFNRFTCAGSIIEDDLIITAASCLQLAWNNRFYRENPSFLSVRVGSDFYESGGENIPVLEIYFHPSYDPQYLLNNIAIMRTLRKVRFHRKNKKVKKILIDTTAAKLPVNTDGITVVGWGAKGIDNIVHNAWENKISFAVMDFYPLEDCRDIYSKKYVTNKNFCAGYITKGSGACNRDVGGPGVVDGYLAGVISFGSPVCGTPDSPTVFTKVGWYADWIEEIMELDVPYVKKRTTLKPPRLTWDYPSFPSRDVLTTPERITPLVDNPLTPASLMNQNIDIRLVKEFLKTMFNSDEIEEYLDIMHRPLPTHTQTEMDYVGRSSTTPSTTTALSLIDYTAHTQMYNVDPKRISYSDSEVDDKAKTSGEIKTTLKHKHSGDNKGSTDKSKDLHSDTITQAVVTQLWTDITDEETKETFDVDNISRNTQKNKPVSKREPIALENSSDSAENIDETILTLLALSDEDKVGAVQNVVDDEVVDKKISTEMSNKAVDEVDDNESLLALLADPDEIAIPSGNFKDFTFRKEKPETNLKNRRNDKKKSRGYKIIDESISEQTLFNSLVEFLERVTESKKS